MTLTGGDPRVLAAAAKIRDAAANLGVVDRRVADEALRDCPALATDPRLAGPVLADCGLTLWVPKTRSWALTCNDASTHTLTLGCPKSSETRNPGMSSMPNRLSERGRDGRDAATVRDQAG